MNATGQFEKFTFCKLAKPGLITYPMVAIKI